MCIINVFKCMGSLLMFLFVNKNEQKVISKIFSFTFNDKCLALKLIYQKLGPDGTLYEIKHLKNSMKRQAYTCMIL